MFDNLDQYVVFAHCEQSCSLGFLLVRLCQYQLIFIVLDTTSSQLQEANHMPDVKCRCTEYDIWKRRGMDFITSIRNVEWQRP